MVLAKRISTRPIYIAVGCPCSLPPAALRVPLALCASPGPESRSTPVFDCLSQSEPPRRVLVGCGSSALSQTVGLPKGNWNTLPGKVRQVRGSPLLPVFPSSGSLDAAGWQGRALFPSCVGAGLWRGSETVTYSTVGPRPNTHVAWGRP